MGVPSNSKVIPVKAREFEGAVSIVRETGAKIG
jgi:hypothetical protein